MKNKINTKNRKGISSIVGSVFFIIIIVTALGYVSYSMNQLDNFSQAIIVKNQQDRDKLQEDFQVVSATTNNNKFNVTIQNTGMVPINITRVWVENKTDPTWSISKYDVNQIISPGQILGKIGQSLPLTAKPTQAYGLTFVTDRGNSKEILVNSASARPLMLQLFVIPDTVESGFDTTLLFAVTNNMSNNGGLSNLAPNLSVNSTGASATLVSGPEPNVYPFLAQGDTAYFKWVYSISGNAGQKVSFTASLNNGYLGNFVSRNVTINTLQGIPTMLNSTLNKAETGSDPNLVTLTPPASKGEYRIHFSMNVKAATSAVVGWTVSYKDAEGGSVTPTNLLLSKVGANATALTFTTSGPSDYYGDAYIDVDNSATKIVVKTTSSGTLTAAMASATIEKIQ